MQPTRSPCKPAKAAPVRERKRRREMPMADIVPAKSLRLGGRRVWVSAYNWRNPRVMAKSKEDQLPFEKGLEDLEKIVKKLESAELPLEESLALFEQGVELSEACRKRLEEAETRIEILLKKGRKIEAEPFELDDDGEGE